MAKIALSETREIELEDVKAGIRRSLFKAVRSAFKRESANLQAKDLANSIGRDTGFVSRVLTGQSQGITAETAAIFLDALGYQLRVEAVKKSELLKSNRDCRIHSANSSSYKHEGFIQSSPSASSDVLEIRMKPEAVYAR